MDDKSRNSMTIRKMTRELPPLSHTEKENDITPTIRSSLLPVSSSSPIRRSNATLIPFQPIDEVAVTTNTDGISNQCRVNSDDRHMRIPNTNVNGTSYTAITTSSSSNKSSRTEYLDVSSLRAISPVSSTTFPTTSTTSSSMPLEYNDTSTTCHVHHPSIHSSITTSIESILQQYPKEFISKDSSKMIKLQQLASSLMTNDHNEGENGTGTTERNIAASEIVHIVMTDMIQLHEMLSLAKNQITELQNGNVQSLCRDRPSNEERHSNTTSRTTDGGNINSSENRSDMAGDDSTARRGTCDIVDSTIDRNCRNDEAALLLTRISTLELELQASQAAIHQLKNQKQHVIANTKKKKVLLDDFERRLLNTENELQTVLSERNQLRASLQEMTEMRDSYKQKLRNQQEMVKDSKNFMMEYKNRLQKTQQMRSLENELLDNFRKLAIHTG